MEHTPSPTAPQNPLLNYQFSSDELRVLRECNTESFFQRSLPLGTGFGTATYLAIKHGYLQSSQKYGAVPKVIVGVVIGYFLGKFSYQQKCAEKLMQLPNSKLGEILLQRKRGGVMGSIHTDQNLNVGLALAPFVPSSADIYSDLQPYDHNPSTSLNLDIETRPYSGLDTYQSPQDSALDQEIPLEPVKPGMSYEELRKRNREEYNVRQQTALTQPNVSDPPSPRSRSAEMKSRTSEEGEIKPFKTQTNKYGDRWTD